MNDRELDHLLQEVLDGHGTPEQVARLESWLAGSEQGRARRRELEAVFAALRSVPLVDAPADLKDGVMLDLQARAAAYRVTPRATHTAARGVPRFRFALGLLTGVALGVIGFVALRGLPIDPDRLPVEATMAPPRPPRPPDDAVVQRWTTGDLVVEGITWRDGATRWLLIRPIQGTYGQVEVDFDPSGLTAVAVREVTGAGAHARIHRGRVVVEMSPKSLYDIEFMDSGRSSDPIRVTVRAGSEPATGEIAPPSLPGQGK